MSCVLFFQRLLLFFLSILLYYIYSIYSYIIYPFTSIYSHHHLVVSSHIVVVLVRFIYFLLTSLFALSLDYNRIQCILSACIYSFACVSVYASDFLHTVHFLSSHRSLVPASLMKAVHMTSTHYIKITLWQLF